MKKIVDNSEFKNLIYDKTAKGIVNSHSIVNGVSLTPEKIVLTDSQAYDMYVANDWINAVVGRIAEDCAKIKPIITLIDKTKKLKPKHKRFIEHWNNMMLRPNLNKESFSALREKFIRDGLIYGRATMEKTFNKFGFLKELYTIKSSTIELKTDKHGVIQKRGFVQKKEGKEITFSNNEIIFTVFKPSTECIYGEKHLDTLANTVASDILRSTYNSNFFVNSAEAGGILSLEGFKKQDIRKFQQAWKSAHKGAGNAHRTAVVNVPVKWVQTTITNRDMQFSEYGRELMMKIFAVYKVQPFIMGVIDGTTGKLNSSEQTSMHKSGTLKPILMKEAWAYTTEILHDGFGMTDLQVEFEGVDLADSVTQTAIDREDINAGIVTINEVRNRRGLSPVTWGDTPICFLPGGMQINPETGKLEQVTNDEENGDDKDDNKKDDDKKDDSKKDDNKKEMKMFKFLEKSLKNLSYDETIEILDELEIKGQIGKFVLFLVDEHKKGKTYTFSEMKDIYEKVYDKLGENNGKKE
jgi:HK97 family phage portal protein